MKLLSAAAAISACLLMSGNIMAQTIQIKVDDKAFTGELNNRQRLCCKVSAETQI